MKAIERRNEQLNKAIELLNELEHHCDEEQRERLEHLHLSIKYDDKLDDDFNLNQD